MISIRSVSAGYGLVNVLRDVSIEVKAGEIHAIMGRNGAGKSTLANVVMGHPAYEITSGNIFFKGEPLENLEVFQRARAGMFLSFQYPAAIPGVQVGTFLKKSVASVRDDPPKGRAFRKELTAAMDKLSMDKSFLSRYVNDGFSGGEKKRLEILQMLLLQPHLALLDETDSGLDIDALRIVAQGINEVAADSACLIITHYQRLLDEITPDYVHVMASGRILRTGGRELALELEQTGYDWVDKELAAQGVA